MGVVRGAGGSPRPAHGSLRGREKSRSRFQAVCSDATPASVDRGPVALFNGGSFRFTLERPVMILVTGATGFVGHQLVRAMRSRFPGRPIRILNRAPPQSSVLPDGVQVVLGDIADAKAAAEAVRGTHVVIHLAALQTNARVIQEMRRVNA